MWRKTVNVVMLSLTGLCALVAVSALFFILGYLVYHGGRDVDWNFFTKLPTPVGEEGGGMANAIVGSGKLLLLAAPIGVPHWAAWRRVSGWSSSGGKTVPFVVRYTADMLNGVPSIVIGIFAYAVAVMPVRHFSTFAGGVALGIMMIPIVLRSTEEFLERRSQGDARRRYGTGGEQVEDDCTPLVLARRSERELSRRFYCRAGSCRGRNRAPLLFTAFGNRFWSPGWGQPTASLPVMIFTYAVGPYDDWHRQAWAAGLVLLGLVLLINIIVRTVLSRGPSAQRS